MIINYKQFQAAKNEYMKLRTIKNELFWAVEHHAERGDTDQIQVIKNIQGDLKISMDIQMSIMKEYNPEDSDD